MKVRMKFEKEVDKMCDIANRIEREALNKGEKIGEERGLLQGKIETLIKQLTKKLRVLSEELIHSIQISSLEKLDELLDSIFDIESEKDVLHILNA